jgi:DNA (cytosine-5)-methyltransferase 1
MGAELDTGIVFDDVRALRRGHLSEPIDIVFGGFPCQPFSHAARGRNNAPDLWPEMFRLVRECEPRFVFAENVTREAIERAARDLAGHGYVVRCLELPSSVVGTPHERKRFWLLADAYGDFKLCGTIDAEMASVSASEDVGGWPQHRPELLGVDDGLPHRMDRLHALGNAVVPAQAREAFKRLMGFV